MNAEPLPPGQRQKLRIIGFGMLAGALVLLGVVAVLLPRVATTGLEPVGYVGVGVALVSPILARSVRLPGAQGRLVQMAILEASAIVCGGTALVSHTYWPLLAAALPVALLLREVTSSE